MLGALYDLYNGEEKTNLKTFPSGGFRWGVENSAYLANEHMYVCASALDGDVNLAKAFCRILAMKFKFYVENFNASISNTAPTSNISSLTGMGGLKLLLTHFFSTETSSLTGHLSFSIGYFCAETGQVHTCTCGDWCTTVLSKSPLSGLYYAREEVLGEPGSAILLGGSVLKVADVHSALFPNLSFHTLQLQNSDSFFISNFNTSAFVQFVEGVNHFFGPNNMEVQATGCHKSSVMGAGFLSFLVDELPKSKREVQPDVVCLSFFVLSANTSFETLEPVEGVISQRRRLCSSFQLNHQEQIVFSFSKVNERVFLQNSQPAQANIGDAMVPFKFVFAKQALPNVVDLLNGKPEKPTKVNDFVCKADFAIECVQPVRSVPTKPSTPIAVNSMSPANPRTSPQLKKLIPTTDATNTNIKKTMNTITTTGHSSLITKVKPVAIPAPLQSIGMEQEAVTMDSLEDDVIPFVNSLSLVDIEAVINNCDEEELKSLHCTVSSSSLFNITPRSPRPMFPSLEKNTSPIEKSDISESECPIKSTSVLSQANSKSNSPAPMVKQTNMIPINTMNNKQEISASPIRKTLLDAFMSVAETFTASPPVSVTATHLKKNATTNEGKEFFSTPTTASSTPAPTPTSTSLQPKKSSFITKNNGRTVIHNPQDDEDDEQILQVSRNPYHMQQHQAYQQLQMHHQQYLHQQQQQYIAPPQVYSQFQQHQPSQLYVTYQQSELVYQQPLQQYYYVAGGNQQQQQPMYY